MERLVEKEPNLAAGDHPQVTRSESGVELKSLLKLIDNVIESDPATDEPPKYIPRLQESLHPGYITLTETLWVPVKKFPKYNFVGRILGPRGMTVKSLEKETGCKIFVRGRAYNSLCKTARVPSPKPTPPRSSLSNVSKSSFTEEPLHVYIECSDFPEIAHNKMSNAVSIVQDLLSPPPDGKDELKRQQLVDISLINGTYRATSASNEIGRQFRRQPFRQNVDPTSHPIHDLDLQPLSMEFGGPMRGELGNVYGIAQQKRIWQKPRGPDTQSEEYAKSVSSREFVSDIVSKTKHSPVKTSSNDTLYQLPETVVNETLKVAHNLLDSHRHLTFDLQDRQKAVGTPPPPSQTIYHHRGGNGDFPLPDFSVPPPPIRPLANPDYPIYYVYPPPPPHIPYGSQHRW